MPLPRSTSYRSAGLSQSSANHYSGNAFVYVLASRIDPNLCKIGKGNPTTRCDYWNHNSPHGGMLNNNLSVFAAYEFDTEAQALECEAQAHAVYNFVNLNPNAAGGEQEFFAVPPQQAEKTLDLLYDHFDANQQQATERAQREAAEQAYREASLEANRWMQAVQHRDALLADAEQRITAARIEGYNNAPMVIAEREAAERAQREAAELARREAAERAAQEAIERTNRGLREAAEQAKAAARAQACEREMLRRTEEGKRNAAIRKDQEQKEQAKRDAKRRAVLWPLYAIGFAFFSYFAFEFYSFFQGGAPQREAARARAIEKAQADVKRREDAERDFAAMQKAQQQQAQKDQQQREQEQRETVQRIQRDIESTRRKSIEQDQKEKAQQPKAEVAQIQQVQPQQVQQSQVPALHFVQMVNKSTNQLMNLHVRANNVDDAMKKSIVVWYLDNGYKVINVF